MDETLKTTHVGIITIKMSKIQKLTKDFGNPTMEDDEFFDNFYGKQKDIVNTLFNLGANISSFKIMRKILRFILQTFQPRDTTIKKSKDIDT